MIEYHIRIKNIAGWYCVEIWSDEDVARKRFEWRRQEFPAYQYQLVEVAKTEKVIDQCG